MATRNSKRPYRAEMAVWRKFQRQPAQMTQAQIDQVDHLYYDDNDAIARRMALVCLTRSGAELIDGVKKNPEYGEELFEVSKIINTYSKRVRALAEMMDAASVRLMLASAAVPPGARQ